MTEKEVLKRRAARKAAAEAERQRKNEEAARLNAEHRANKIGSYSRARQGARVILPIKDGCVFVVSDQHYHPDAPPSVAHQASLVLARKLKPYAIVANGDALDGASISRWPASSYISLGEQPTVVAEIKESQARLGDYEKLTFVKYRSWNMGNHDSRFETKLAQVAPQYAGVSGFTLKEHFPGWLPAWSTWFCATPDMPPEVVVKHRFKGGAYAAMNNTLWAGCSMVSGHDHMLWAKAMTDYNGTRWGIDAGTISAIDSAHFTHYTEDNPVNWQSGFVILHFKGGKFIGPELVHALPDGRVPFRGDLVAVK